jgi:uncharacterized protein (TIGR02145 family)
MFLKELQNKLFIFIFLFTASTIKTSAQFLGGQIKTQKKCEYPVGSIFCIGPTAVVEVYNPVTGKVWMDRNLGATSTATNSTDAAAYGDSYQWGRLSDGHQCRNSPTTNQLSWSFFNPNPDVPLTGEFIISNSSLFDWRSPQNNNLWQGVNSINNPCPCDFRLPTSAEWNAERASWSSNNASGAFASVLKLTRNGFRRNTDGVLINVGAGGDYYSSTISGTDVFYLQFDGSTAFNGTSYRSIGRAVRCIKN